MSARPQPVTPKAAASNPPARPAPPARRRGFGAGFFLLLFLVTVVAALIYFAGVRPRQQASQDLNREQKISEARSVIFARAHLAAAKTELPLPGTVEAFQQSSIYARTSGYVKRWTADIGDVVAEGAVLAELDTPEIDQQLSQARAAEEQAKESLAIAKTAADRWNSLVKQHAVSQEEADEKTSTNRQSQASYTGSQADVARLSDLQNFKVIRAPFAGTITFRNIELGNLVSAGTDASRKGTEIYRIAQTDPLRVFLDVPEANSRAIKPGVEARLHVAAYPDRIFLGTVVRSAGALDDTTRTLRTEVRVPNPDGALLPGSYAEVRLQLVDAQPSILIPANTLIVNAAGTSVARVEEDNGRDKVHFLPVKVGRDFGTEVEIAQAIADGDRLVTNPAADLIDGMAVTAHEAPKPPATSPPPPLNPSTPPPAPQS